MATTATAAVAELNQSQMLEGKLVLQLVLVPAELLFLLALDQKQVLEVGSARDAASRGGGEDVDASSILLPELLKMPKRGQK